jgi:hypothetical protein
MGSQVIRPGGASPVQTQDTAQLSAGVKEGFPDVYWGVASGSSIKALRVASQDKSLKEYGFTIDGANIPAPGKAEISYATGNRESLWKGPDWFVDCGGFSELTRNENGQYDSSIESYIEYLERQVANGIDIEYWALRDWPITESLLSEYDRTERDHQRWTVRDHCKTLEAASEAGLVNERGTSPMAVVQGRDTAGYLWMVDYLSDHGLLTDHVCLGSIKDLPAHKVKDVAEAVKSALPERCRLHGLGITKQHLQQPEIRECFDTIDTQAWNRQTRQLPAEFDEVRHTWIGYLEAYQQYLTKLENDISHSQRSAGHGTKLFEFGQGKKQVSGHTDSSLRQCVCGTTIDPNAIRDMMSETVATNNRSVPDARDKEGCRHCRQTLLNLQMKFLS